MEAATILEKQFEALTQNDYLEKLRAGELDTEQKQKKLLDAYAEGLSMKRLEWQNIQVSIVAGGAQPPVPTFDRSSCLTKQSINDCGGRI
ncbi:hypothetical protein ACQZ5N_22850 [Agrobacterium sp. 22-221-1]